MKFDLKNKKIITHKSFSNLDNFVLKFINVLTKNNIKYVLVSGYVGIYFGRNRHTEDVDLYIEEIAFDKFKKFFYGVLATGFVCLTGQDAEPNFKNYFLEKTSLRFHLKGEIIPNIELKFVKNNIDRYTLLNKIEVQNGPSSFFISPLEMQIVYKLFLGTEKDFEDAKFLYELFKEQLDKTLLIQLSESLDVKTKLKILGDVFE